MKHTHRNQQKGFASIDASFSVIVLTVILFLALSVLPGIFFNIHLSGLEKEVIEVGTAAYQAKKARPNYSEITMQKLCDDKYLTEDYCGSTPGQSANSFGGDITYQTNSSNPGLRDIVVTIPSDPDRINQIADTLASQSREKCTVADGCDTLAVNGNTITITM
ncbi:prepilin-type cleavage/methylation domain-containing protein [Vibrio quintilis]|uniref:Uncharacterized protein n=1 Tax=Vibrio quintilis TaxID=1117707 RepID=A0A1M7YSH3_9VIBR|nr:prepilin-type cleavage/methylation domain-containing protein [Vibrio quintilis]SHO55563.1 hypothetical protein VQ7734_01299 [Vibrio quintilis]